MGTLETCARLIGRMLWGSVDIEKDTGKKTTISREGRKEATRKCVRWKRDKGIERRKKERERDVIYRLLRGCVGFLAKGA